MKDPADRFVLVTRLDPESCVAWAQKAEPADVEAAYSNMVESAATAGADVALADDRRAGIPNGQVHIRIYRVWSGSALTSVALVMATVNRSGGPFQAMLETQRLVQCDDLVNPMVPFAITSELIVGARPSLLFFGGTAFFKSPLRDLAQGSWCKSAQTAFRSSGTCNERDRNGSHRRERAREHRYAQLRRDDHFRRSLRVPR